MLTNVLTLHSEATLVPTDCRFFSCALLPDPNMIALDPEAWSLGRSIYME